MSKEIYSQDTFKCPYCGAPQDMMDWLEDYGMALVTYWGDDGVVDLICHSCEHTFYMREHVARYWRVCGSEKDE